MFKFFTRKSKQIHALFTIFLLLFQNFAPLFFLVPTAKAQTNVNNVSLVLDQVEHQLILGGEASEQTKLSIVYDDNDDTTVPEGVTGLIKPKDNKFENKFFVGTCSTDGECIKDTITNGKLSFENTSYEASFEIKDGQLWLKEGNIFKTTGLKTGQAYVAPQNNQVTITFTKLPENAGNLMIEEILLSEEQVAALGATSNIAYDITSNMENGSFEYNLTLPVPENIEGETKVVFAESVSELAQAQEVTSEVVSDDQVKAEGLDHFTVFVVVQPQDMATTDRVDVYLNHMDDWFFYNDENDTVDNTLGTFVIGPDTAPYGAGSVQISVSGTQRRNLATYKFSGTPLAEITELGYSTYNPSAGNGGSNQRSAYLQFNVDFNGSDTWQKRLIFLPPTGQVQQNTWQAWDAIQGGNALWKYSGTTWPVTGQPGTTAKTWNQILSDYPNIRIRVTDSWLGLRVGEPYSNGYTENIDGFVFGTNDGVTIYNFDPDVYGPTAPTNLGFNSTAPNYSTEPVQIACGGITKTNQISHHWSIVPDAVKYQRQWVYPGQNPAVESNWQGAEEWSTNYTNYRTFGGGTGTEGLWYVRVRAQDSAGNWSAFSEPCAITFDKTAPQAPIITNPTENQNFTTTPILNQWTIPSDNSGIHHYRVEYQYDDGHTFSGAPYRETTINSRNHTPAINEQGGVKFRVQAFDNAGNEGAWSEWRHYYYDASKPSVDLVFPGTGPTVKSFQAVFSEKVNPIDATNPTNYYLSNWPGAGDSGDLNGDATITYDETSKTATITFIHEDWYVSPEQLWGVQDIHDLAGNLLTVNPYQEYSTAMVPPVTTDSGTDANWHNIPVTVTLNCSDVSGSGCKTTYYTVDGSEPTTSSATGNSITLNTDGIHTIKYFSIDNAGNVESIKTAANAVKIDISNPTTPTVLGFLNPSLSCGVVTNIHNTTVDWSNSVDNNGAVTYEYNIDYPLPGGGRGVWSTSLANSQYGGSLNEGLHRIKVRAKDSVGNYSNWSNTCDITADWTTPTTTLTSPTNNFITNTGIDIVGTSNDFNGVDLVTIYYSEAGQNNWQEITTLDNTDSTLFDFSYLWSPAENGTYDIKVSGTDIAGNIEASAYALNVKYDTVLPSSIITNYNLADGGSIETNEFTGLIEGTATDLTSGINHVLLSISHLDFGADESETTYWDATTSAWVTTESMFSATGTNVWNYQLTDVPNGIYNITSHAVDNAGNVENTYNIRIVYDKTIPEVALAINPASPDGDNGWYRYIKPTITLTASDNYNLDHIEYQWNSTSGTWTTYLNPFVTPSEGQNILYYRSIDSVGNVSGLGIKEVKYDKTNPAGEPLEVKVDNVTNNTADATWKKPTDDSDVSHYRVIWRHENGTEYSVETGKDDFAHQLDKLFNGLWTLTVQAVDSAGNFTEKKIDFRVGPGPGSSGSTTGGSVLGATTSTTNGTAPFITQTSGDGDEATTTSDQGSNTANNQPEGTVLGATTCNGLESYLPIILLVAQLLVLLAVEVLNRDAGVGKLVASIAITVAMIPLYYLLRNPDCFTQGSGLDVINNWFAGITIATGLAAKLIGKSLFEEK